MNLKQLRQEIEARREPVNAAREMKLGMLLAVDCSNFPDEGHICCTQVTDADGVTQLLGWHCPRCGKSTSSQGHASTGRFIDGSFRRFADGELHTPCEDGYEDLLLEGESQ